MPPSSKEIELRNWFFNILMEECSLSHNKDDSSADVYKRIDIYVAHTLREREIAVLRGKVEELKAFPMMSGHKNRITHWLNRIVNLTTKIKQLESGG